MSEFSHLSSVLAHWEARQPDAVALRYAGTNRTWAELAQRVRRNAAAQRAAGLSPGDRIAVLDLNHPSCLELTLACAQVGTANAVVNFRLAPAEIAYATMRRRVSCSSAPNSQARSTRWAPPFPHSSG